MTLPAVSEETLAPIVATPLDFDNMTIEQFAKATGFEGLDFTRFGITQIVSLKDQTFNVSDGRQLGNQFFGYANNSRPKYCYKPAISNDDPRYRSLEPKLVFSYDQKTSNGKDLAALLSVWSAQGITYKIQQYLEIPFVMRDTREVVLLSVPESSIPRFSAFIQSVFFSKKKRVSEVLCRVFVGPQVTKAVQPFYPWMFEVAE